MGLIDGAKNKYQKHQEAAAKLKDDRGDKFGALPITEYMGGYGDYKRAIGALTFYEKQTEFKAPLRFSFTIASTEIADVAIEGKDEVNRRVTVTRLLAVGIFAFAFKKKSADKESYLTLVLADGQEAVFHIDKRSPMELKTSLSKAISQVKQAKSIASSIDFSAADEIEKLAELRDKGIIDEEEFATKKKQLLGV
ncbi:MAG: SHOCT domain-containing protein [Actinobacteria bacterium]|nr:SHOCT domain-containing protein [Actinomycetota bacterium]